MIFRRADVWKSLFHNARNLSFTFPGPPPYLFSRVMLVEVSAGFEMMKQQVHLILAERAAVAVRFMPCAESLRVGSFRGKIGYSVRYNKVHEAFSPACFPLGNRFVCNSLSSYVAVRIARELENRYDPLRKA